ncbi:MAG: aldo/keto reductase [Fimbriimonadaceae bacterium]|nr:aldo/keto reductase [Fimbriimonadaceae bacterium]
MIYREFGSTGWQVSAIGLGTWNIGGQWGEVSAATADATVLAAWEAGVNLFDTADAYGIPPGLSEQRLGRALWGRRHEVYLVSKVGNWGRRGGTPLPFNSPDQVRLCCHASLHRLRTDWLDVLLCHEGNLADPAVYLEGLESLRGEGRIRCYGISTDSLEVLQRFNQHGTCAVVEIGWSLLSRGPEDALLPYCADHGIAVLVRGPLRQGLLSGRYDASTTWTDTVRSGWTEPQRHPQIQRELAAVDRLKTVAPAGEPLLTAALRYTITHRSRPVSIPGAKSPEQAALNARAGERELTLAERESLLAALAA